MSTSRRVRLRPEVRREQILAAATEVFYRKGYDHASTRDLSRAAETSIAGIYHHFTDKEHLLFAILDAAVDELLQIQVEAGRVAGGPRERLEAMVRALLNSVVRNRKQVTLLYKEDNRLSPGHRATVRAKQRQSFDLLRQELDALRAEGSLKEIGTVTATFALLGMVNWLFYWYRPEGPLGPGDLARDFCTIFLDGVLKD